MQEVRVRPDKDTLVDIIKHHHLIHVVAVVVRAAQAEREREVKVVPEELDFLHL
jgi:hypothetical protein